MTIDARASVGRSGRAVRIAAANAERRVARLRTSTARVGVFDIVYDEARRGAGPTVVLLHGFTADRQVWTRFAAKLKTFHIVLPDLPGHGATPFVAGAGYSAPDQAKRVLALLDTIGVEQAHVIGNSMGGFIAASMARIAPERVRSVGLVDSAGVESPSPSTIDRLIASGARNPFLLDRAEQFTEFYPLTMAKPPFVPRFVLRAIAQEYLTRKADYAEIFTDFTSRFLLEDELREITAPTWLAWGEQDQLVDISATEVWSAGLPDVKLVTYPELGHMPMFEAPARCARDYLAFLDTVK